MNRYFYIDAEGKQKGTFSPGELRQHINPKTLVWTQGMAQWQRADTVEELIPLFAVDAAPAQAAQSAPVLNQPLVTATAATPQPMGPMPKKWLVESILVTLIPFFCCSNVFSLLGIVAIVYASQVESYFTRGDYAASLSSSRSAGRWTKITLWIAIGWFILMILMVVGILLFAGSIGGLSELGDKFNI